MRDRDRFVFSEEVHLVFARNGTASEGMNADFLSVPYAASGTPGYEVSFFAEPFFNRPRQQKRGTGRTVDFFAWWVSVISISKPRNVPAAIRQSSAITLMPGDMFSLIKTGICLAAVPISSF